MYTTTHSQKSWDLCSESPTTGITQNRCTCPGCGWDNLNRFCLSEDSEPTFGMLGNMTVKLRVAVDAFATNLTMKLFLHFAVQAGGILPHHRSCCRRFMMDNRCGERTGGRQHHVKAATTDHRVRCWWHKFRILLRGILFSQSAQPILP
jgi:hypothetical protein